MSKKQKENSTHTIIKDFELNEYGFEDFDKFFAGDGFTTKSPVTTSRTRASTTNTEDDDSWDFDYDTSDSITEDEEDLDDEGNDSKNDEEIGKTVKEVGDNESLPSHFRPSLDSSASAGSSLAFEDSPNQSRSQLLSLSERLSTGSSAPPDALTAVRQYGSMSSSRRSIAATPQAEVLSRSPATEQLDTTGDPPDSPPLSFVSAIKGRDSNGEDTRPDSTLDGDINDNIPYRGDDDPLNDQTEPLPNDSHTDSVIDALGNKRRVSFHASTSGIHPDEVEDALQTNNDQYDDDEDKDNYFDYEDEGGINDGDADEPYSSRNATSSGSKKSPITQTPVRKPAPGGLAQPKNKRTPLTSVSTPGSRDFPRGAVLPDETFRPDDSELAEADEADTEPEDDTDRDQSGYTDESASFIKSAHKRAREYADEDEQTAEEDGIPVRRSRRATKGVRFEFWKNERPIYEKDRFVGVFRAAPTPKKTIRRAGGRNASSSTLSGTKGGQPGSSGNSSRPHAAMREWADEDEQEQQATQPRVHLPRENKYLTRESDEGVWVWDDEQAQVRRAQVFCAMEGLPLTALPITSARRTKNKKVGSAAQFFSTNTIHTGLGPVGGFIAGFVKLPPGAIKDQEMIGEYVQVFFVGDCQELSVELAIGDPSIDEWDDSSAQRVLLKRGDSFYVLPGNSYRLENHSQVKTCLLNWVIMKPCHIDGEGNAGIEAAETHETGQSVVANEGFNDADGDADVEGTDVE